MNTDAAECRICGHPEHDLIYDGPIRSGGADSGTEDGYRVFRCRQCRIVFLHPLPPDLDRYYSGEDYWAAHHGPVDVAKLHRKHDQEQSRWFSEVGTENLRGQRVADFGCGAGIFLDHARSLASATVGVDATHVFSDHLASQGHEFCTDGTALDAESIDVAVTFDTLEHVVDPIDFLVNIHRALRDGGTLWIGVPNQGDFLKRLVPDYLPFFYHRSHLFYFDAESLGSVLKKSGFAILDTRYVHKYDIMNMVGWAHDKVGRGRAGGDVFDNRTERNFRVDLERQGIASHILIKAARSES